MIMGIFGSKTLEAHKKQIAKLYDFKVKVAQQEQEMEEKIAAGINQGIADRQAAIAEMSKELQELTSLRLNNGL